MKLAQHTTIPFKPGNEERLEYREGIGVVLSGGGVKGVAHVAFLQRLHQLGIQVSTISGSSAGALVGALYSAGKSPEDIIEFFRRTPLFKMSWIATSKPGLFETEKYMKVIRHHLPKTFEELNIPLVISAVNLETSKVEYFSSGDLCTPLLASCAVPFLFTPVMINGQWHADGGVMDNFPVSPLKGKVRTCLGSYVCKPSSRDKKDLNSILKLTNHANALLLHAANVHKFNETDLTIEFDLDEFYSFNTKQIDQIYKRALETVQSDMSFSTLNWVPDAIRA